MDGWMVTNGGLDGAQWWVLKSTYMRELLFSTDGNKRAGVGTSVVGNGVGEKLYNSKIIVLQRVFNFNLRCIRNSKFQTN